MFTWTDSSNFYEIFNLFSPMVFRYKKFNRPFKEVDGGVYEEENGGKTGVVWLNAFGVNPDDITIERGEESSGQTSLRVHGKTIVDSSVFQSPFDIDYQFVLPHAIKNSEVLVKNYNGLLRISFEYEPSVSPKITVIRE